MNVIYELLPVSGTTALVALVALALGITAGAVGSFAVLQARSLVGDALAHAALPGIAVAFILSGARDPATLMIGAVVAAAVAAALILFLERTPRLRADAVIAVVLAGAFSAGVVLLTWISASGRGDQGGLESYLFGQAAGAVEADLITASVVMVSALLIVGVLARPLGAVIFDRAFSSSIGMPVRGLEAISVALLVLAVVVGLRMVGAILMVVM
ncbi:MAG: metal ABC transporter permease, partial [Thermoleophilia bacterium]